MSDLTFECPECHHHKLEVIEANVTVVSEINTIDSDGQITYGEQINEGGEDCHVDRYQCMECGWSIPDVDSEESLIEWLQSQE